MFGDEIVVHTRLIPPRLPRRWLRRPRLDQMLAAAAELPLTIVSASAGYGKSSVLASFAARGGWPTAWLGLGQGVDDPLVFLLHLIHAWRNLVPGIGERAAALLERGDQRPQVWGQALDALINDLARSLDDETILVVDDYHVVDDQPDIRALIERLILQRPPLLHVLLSSRTWPQLSCLPTLQVRGELLAIGETDLAFTEQEIADLFALVYDHALSVAEALAVSEQTGGWAIALQLMWQGARRSTTDDRQTTTEQDSHAAPPWSAVGGRSSFPRELLFSYLAQDVLAGQPEDIQRFLLRSSALSELTPATCDRIMGGTSSGAWLRVLYRRGLFLTLLGPDLYRYHPLFHAFMQERARATLPEWRELHTRAATYYREIGAGEKVLYHLQAIDDHAGMARELERLAQPWLDSGRLVTLLAWLDQLPPDAFSEHPALLVARGDTARMLARFEEAVQAYASAEQIYAASADPAGQSRALEGQALVYLDTVRPARATDLLRRAFKLLPRQQLERRAALLRLVAENRLNSGRPNQAARLYRAADRLGGLERPGPPPPRVLLRLGRLEQARAQLEHELPRDRAAVVQGRRPEAHREVTLLLSLVGALQGDEIAALRYAQQGLDAARQLGSTLSEAIAHIRLGHALQLGQSRDDLAANTHYLQAITLADTFGVQRTKAEAYVGLTLLHGFNGDVVAARAAAHEGLAIVERSGDQWSVALLWAALGAVGVAGGHPQAEPWLQVALSHYQASGDAFGQAIVKLWMSIWHHRAGRLEAAAQCAIETLALAQRYGYAGLLTAITLLGPRDRMMLVPVLLAGRADADWKPYAQDLLAQGFPAIAADDATQTYHPGSTLRITAFERLRVWRGGEEIEPRAWQRKKAQQMLALLLTNRRRWLLREQICDLLWSEDSKAEAETQFKVTLNALNSVLEPARPPRTSPFYVRRQGGAYRFCPADGVWLDVEEFELRLDTARSRIASGAEDDLAAAQADLITAVELYQGDYLSDSLYEDWAREERERLVTRYLEAATTLADLFIRRNQLSEAIGLCEAILSRDPCWEDAYVLLMRAYAQQGNRRLALASYERCVRNLRAQLDVAPLPQTTQVYEEIKRKA